MKTLVLVTKKEGCIEYNEEAMEKIAKEIEVLAADYFDLYACTPGGAALLQQAVRWGNVYIGNDVPDGRYVSAGGDEVYVLGGRVVTEEEFVKEKLGRRGLRALRNGDDDTLKDLLSPWTW